MKVVSLLSVRWWWKLLFKGDHSHEPLRKRGEPEDCTSIVLEEAAGAEAADVPRKLTFQEVQSAANNFDPRSRCENPAYFRGKSSVCGTGKRVVVKVVETGKQNRRLKGLVADEVWRMSEIQDKNLVELRGYCLHRSRLFLVYHDFMSFGSLEKLLLSGGSGRVSWISRLQILQDIARGLAHLHSNKVLHLDIKPENVFMDANMRARVSDFGFCKLEKKSNIRGTPGYMPPEWLQMRVSEKTDVYSFGMILLEVVSGVKLIHSKQQMKRHLGTWAFQMAHRDELSLMIDPNIAKEVYNSTRQVERVIRVGLWCIQADARLRPSMNSILRMLRGELEVLHPPLPPFPPEGGMIDMDFSLSVVMDMMHLQQPLKKNRFFKLLSK